MKLIKVIMYVISGEKFNILINPHSKLPQDLHQMRH
jgi:hypothetical protein